MKSEEITELLGQLRFLQALPKPAQTRIIGILEDISTLRRVPCRGRWITENEATENMGYVLLKGSARIHKTDFPEVRCEAPELLGEVMQYNPAHVRTATVEAVTDCVVLRFSWEKFWDAIRTHLAPDHIALVEAAVRDIAWQHFTG